MNFIDGLMQQDSYFRLYVINGGILMWALIPCSIWLVAATVSAALRLREAKVLPDRLLEAALRVKTRADRVAFADGLKTQSSPLATALVLTLKEVDLRGGHHPHRRHLEAAMGEAVAHTVDDLYEGLRSFSTLYTVSPLLGLLGTILGMVKSFRSFGLMDEKSLSTLSMGIQEALITTLWGLFIAIPSYFIAQVFQARIREFEREKIPRKIHEIIDALYAAQGPVIATPEEVELPLHRLTVDEVEVAEDPHLGRQKGTGIG